ncbi:MAG TPA: preprotein translocase subunit SecY [Candidatus Saccharimonadales bacterium]|nr:preprotein translocase subunit SecY [Candidatus Saccharimonadales bacterium]
MREYLLQIWKSRDLRNKVLFTLALLVFIRIISHIPIPGIDKAQLAAFMSQSQNQIFNLLSVFTGGSLTKLSIAMLGVGPYITSSIIIQLLTKAIPAWENLQKESNSGREKLNQYGRYLTVPLAIIQGYSTLVLLRSQNVLPNLSAGAIWEILAVITATSIFIMWLGELITEKGLANGISLIIALGIVSGLPTQISNIANSATGSYFTVIVFAAIAVLTIAVIVLVNDAERKIPITYARQAAGAGSSVNSYLPLKVNAAGVIPIIFALSFLTFPVIIARFLSTAHSTLLVNIAEKVTLWSNNNLYYGIAYFILVLIFTFFYTYIVFQPEQVAENLQKQGSFIPGVRPGSETVAFLKYTTTRITVIGAVFLAIIAVLPKAVSSGLNITSLTIGGTSVLIVVSVVIETSRMLNSQIVMRRYDTL